MTQDTMNLAELRKLAGVKPYKPGDLVGAGPGVGHTFAAGGLPAWCASNSSCSSGVGQLPLVITPRSVSGAGRMGGMVKGLARLFGIVAHWRRCCKKQWPGLAS